MDRSHQSFARLTALARALRRPTRAAGGAAEPGADAVPLLARCREELLRFGRDSDQEFTALAQELARFGGELADLRRQAARLSAVVEDRDEERALSSAYALYKSSVDLVHASLGIAVSEQEQMQIVERQLLHTCRARGQFERSDMMLRLLTLNLRMEAVRLEPEDRAVFFNVAANIAEIAEKMLGSSRQAFDRIEATVGEAAADRGELRQLEEMLHRRAHHSVATIFGELERLRAALAPCAERNRGIEGSLERTVPITLRMVMALQQQDIVRQKLEHIATGFGDIAERLPAAVQAPGPAGAFVLQAAAVQHAQLRAARAEIERAGDEVTGGMTQLLDHGQTLLADYTELEKAVCGAFNDCRLADLYREQITDLAGIAAQGQATNEKVARSVARIEEIVRVFSQEIAHQEFAVKIVALNAQIAAARMSSAGALNKLSEEASRVSAEIGQITAALAGELDGVLQSLQQISAQAASFLSIVSREKQVLEQGAVVVSEQLRRLGEQIRSDAARTSRQFGKLFGETTTLLQRLHFPEMISASFAPAEQLCLELQETMVASSSVPLDSSAAAILAAHRERYTMEEERRAHAAALGTSTAAAAPVAAVELFAAPAPPAGAEAVAEGTAAAPADPAAGSASPAAEPPTGAAAPKPELGPGIELF